MWRLAGRFDPATGVTLAQLLQRQTETRFHQPRPELCPTDPVLMHEFLQAQALIDLITGTGVSAGCGTPADPRKGTSAARISAALWNRSFGSIDIARSTTATSASGSGS